jgi:DNA-binding NarL/FixJ family response regulator
MWQFCRGWRDKVKHSTFFPAQSAISDVLLLRALPGVEEMSENKNENRSTVLIVEDEFLIALDLEAAMSGLGYEICGLAPNGDEARSLAMHHQPDVVLVDVYLGGAREGIETARWLRDVCDVSVVFVTAHTDAATVERIKEVVPGSPILSKPVYREHLAKAVAAVTH